MSQLDEQTMAAAAGDDHDPVETVEWLASLRYVLESEGPQRARCLVSMLNEVLARKGLATHGPLNTPLHQYDSGTPPTALSGRPLDLAPG